MYRATHPHPRCQLALGDVLIFRDGKRWSLKVESSHSSGWTHNHAPPRFLPNQQHWERSTICWIPNGSHKTPSNISIQSLGTHCCPPLPTAEWALSRVYISHKSVALPNWWPEIFLRYIDFVARQMILVFDAWLKIYVLQQTFMMSLYDDMNCFNTCNVFTKCQTEDLLLSLSLSLCCSGHVS